MVLTDLFGWERSPSHLSGAIVVDLWVMAIAVIETIVAWYALNSSTFIFWSAIVCLCFGLGFGGCVVFYPIRKLWKG